MKIAPVADVKTKKTWNGSCCRGRRGSRLYSANRDGASRRGKGRRAINSGRLSNNVIADAPKKAECFERDC
jgi:hypothetical protein